MQGLMSVLETLFLFNPLHFGKEDLSLNEKTYTDRLEDGLKSLVFTNDAISEK